MKIQIQPNRWSCLPTAFAMALDTKVKFLIEKIGHDGSEIIWPEFEEPDNRRSFHPQELVDYVWWRGLAVTPFEPYPSSLSRGKESYRINFPQGNQVRLLSVLKTHKGVLTGRSVATQRHHAVAWDNVTGKIYNPNGNVEDIGAFAINIFWAIGNGL